MADGSASGRRACARQSPLYKPVNTSYSHISILAAPEDDFSSRDSADFLPRPSLQGKTGDKLAYSRKVTASSSNPLSPAGSHPSTFAEAAISIQFRGANAKEDEHSPSRSVKSLMPLNILKRKKKVQRWATLDLNAVGDVNEAASNFSDAATSRDVSPTLTTSNPIISQLDSTDQQPQSFLADTAAGEKRRETSLRGFLLPGQIQSAASYDHVGESIENQNENGPQKDTDEGGEKTISGPHFTSIMPHISNHIPPAAASSGEDVFDTLTWDPDLPQASPADKSPEKVTGKSKVAYTTVGSVFDPNSAPHFAAPHRIQREGAGRRPLMPTTNRQYDSLSQNRGPPPSLGHANSMQYNQYLQQIPSTSESLLKSRSSMCLVQTSMPQLTEQEKQVLGKLDEAISKLSLASRKPPNPALASQVSSSSSSNARLATNDDEFKRTYGALGMKQGLEKMQTLQRLARFENPMREHALSRLSEFAVAAQNESKHSAGDSGSDSQQFYTSEGKPNHAFQFLPQGLASLSPQSNPLLATLNPSSNLASLARLISCPQPLTAGPPGQRQSNQAFLAARLATSGLKATTINSSSITRQSLGLTTHTNADFSQGLSVAYEEELHTNSPWSTQTPLCDENSYEVKSGLSYFDFSNGDGSNWPGRTQLRPQAPHTRIFVPAVAPIDRGPHTTLRDTLRPEDMAKYYSKGLPTLGIYSPLADEHENIYYDSLEHRSLKTKEERQDAIDVFFYYGQRRWKMTTEDHIIELEHRQNSNPFGPIARPRNVKMLTPEEVEAMSVAEAVEPVIDGLFGTLLAYAETSKCSRARLSKWIRGGAVEYIDDSEEGNRSCFGEDWGRAVHERD